MGSKKFLNLHFDEVEVIFISSNHEPSWCAIKMLKHYLSHALVHRDERQNFGTGIFYYGVQEETGAPASPLMKSYECNVTSSNIVELSLQQNFYLFFQHNLSLQKFFYLIGLIQAKSRVNPLTL